MVEVAYSNFINLSDFTNAAWQISYAANLQAAWSGADFSPEEWGVSTLLIPDFIYSHFEADYNGHTQFEGLDNLAFFGDNARAPSVSSDYAVKIDFKDSLPVSLGK